MRASRVPIAIVGIAIMCWVGWTIIQMMRADELFKTSPHAALRIEPDHPQALLKLAYQQLETKDYDAATGTARHLLTVEPGQGDAFAILALAALGRGDANSDQLMRIALQRAPRSLDVRTHAMVSAMQQGDLAVGMEQLDAMLRLSPKRGQVLFLPMVQQASDPRFATELVAVLVKSPPWKSTFLSVLSRNGKPFAVNQIYSGLAQRNALSLGDLGRWLDRQLRDDRWGEAYAYWIGTLDPLPEHLPLVYNGSFESEPTNLGFDWRKMNVQGVYSSLEPTPGASGERAAHFHFIGRPVAGGDLRQPLLLAPGRYRLALRARAEFLHSDQGLQWTISCQDGPVVASLGPLEGNFDWRLMTAELEIPAERCPGQWLELLNPAIRGTAQQVIGDLWIDEITIAPLQTNTRPL